MNPDVIAATPQEGHVLLLTFANGERRLFSVRPYRDRGVFRDLCDDAYFRRVRVESGFVAWPNDQDFSVDTLYLRSTPLAPAPHFDESLIACPSGNP